MASDIERQCERYAARLAAGCFRTAKNSTPEAQVERYAIGQGRNVAVWRVAREELCSLGMASVWFPYYRAWLLETDKHIRRLDGRVRNTEVVMSFRKWATRGLDEDVLRRLLKDVLSFDLDLALAGMDPAGV